MKKTTINKLAHFCENFPFVHHGGQDLKGLKWSKNHQIPNEFLPWQCEPYLKKCRRVSPLVVVVLPTVMALNNHKWDYFMIYNLSYRS